EDNRSGINSARLFQQRLHSLYELGNAGGASVRVIHTEFDTDHGWLPARHVVLPAVERGGNPVSADTGIPEVECKPGKAGKTVRLEVVGVKMLRRDAVPHHHPGIAVAEQRGPLLRPRR